MIYFRLSLSIDKDRKICFESIQKGAAGRDSDSLTGHTQDLSDDFPSFGALFCGARITTDTLVSGLNGSVILVNHTHDTQWYN